MDCLFIVFLVYLLVGERVSNGLRRLFLFICPRRPLPRPRHTLSPTLPERLFASDDCGLRLGTSSPVFHLYFERCPPDGLFRGERSVLFCCAWTTMTIFAIKRKFWSSCFAAQNIITVKSCCLFYSFGMTRHETENTAKIGRLIGWRDAGGVWLMVGRDWFDCVRRRRLVAEGCNITISLVY